MKTFEIYFNDLNENAQKELMELVGIDSPSEMNWDMDICPIAMYDFEEGKGNDVQENTTERRTEMKIALFTTTQSDLLKYNDTIVNVGAELNDNERDFEVGRMWHITFCDGTQTDAFEDELKFY